jgi:hypothetical protein
MYRKPISLVLIAILALSAVMLFRVSPVFAQEPYIAVCPPNSAVGMLGTINIKMNVSSTVPFI